MKKVNLIVLGLSILILNGCMKKNEEVSTSSENISSSSSDKSSTVYSQTKNTDVERYPKISKELLNGKSWYEGASTNNSDQPREGFNAGKFYDLFGNSLDYEIVVSDTEKKYNIMDSVKNEIVSISILTEIKVNKPDVSGEYRDVFFPLYYKYDGTLMIAHGDYSSNDYEFISYQLEDIDLSITENQKIESNNDLDIVGINNGDFTSLVGTWINGENDILIINSDGTTNQNWSVYGVINSDKTSKIPYANLSNGGPGGAALGLYKIGFKNPDGDNSDSTKPRLTIAQQGGAYPASAYYYRQEN